MLYTYYTSVVPTKEKNLALALHMTATYQVDNEREHVWTEPN